MAVNSYVNFIGWKNNAKAEVEANSKALRAHLKPNDYGGVSGGWFAYSLPIVQCPNVTPVTNAPLVAFRWSSAQTFGRLRWLTIDSVDVSGGSQATTYSAVFARDMPKNYDNNFIAAQSTPGIGSSNVRNYGAFASPPRLRGTYPTPAYDPPVVGQAATDGTTSVSSFGNADVLYFNGATAQGMTQTLAGTVSVASPPIILDPQPFASVSHGTKTGVQDYMRSVDLFRCGWGDTPIEFSTAQGFVVTASQQAGNTNNYITVNWMIEEVPTFFKGSEYI
ncbi:MAG TPA: hypothetical protein VFV92_01045 [Candidatus Bathyarchaeia archaeon]|nr:hypothetical protein [Candidatus Bathyarchaeia archaeon]